MRRRVAPAGAVRNAHPEAVTLNAKAAGRTKPLLRGVLHQYSFFLAVGVGVVLTILASGVQARIGAAVFAVAVAAMFGASALHHRITWTPSQRLWTRRVDHAGIYLLIAGTYTPFGLLVLDGPWRIIVLACVWAGAAVAIVLGFAWAGAPRWLSAVIAIGLGWIGIAVFPQLLDRLGAGAVSLVLLGGILYTVGAAVYALRRPDPIPSVFGYHEVFHALVVAAVALQYVAVAFFVVT